MSFKGFEHKLLKNIRENFKDLSGQIVYVACSGGADSVALFIALKAISPVLGCELRLLHIHHGDTSDLAQKEFRDESQVFCESLALKHKCEFVMVKANKTLKSEEDCRNFRLREYQKHKTVFTAHHKDDFLETMLIRLIRGTGPQGLKEPFTYKTKSPFLEVFHRREIVEYLSLIEQSHMEDPSNSEDVHLRNWVRNTWLKSLDKKRGISGLAQSLNLIYEHLNSSNEDFFTKIHFKGPNLKSGFIEQSYWLGLSRFQKQSSIAHILHKSLKTGYTKGHVDEILKHLDLPQKQFRFTTAGLIWTKDEEVIGFQKS